MRGRHVGIKFMSKADLDSEMTHFTFTYANYLCFEGIRWIKRCLVLDPTTVMPDIFYCSAIIANVIIISAFIIFKDPLIICVI